MAAIPSCSYFCLAGHRGSWCFTCVHHEYFLLWMSIHIGHTNASVLFASTVSPLAFRNMVSAWWSFISNDSSYIIPSLRMVSICFPILIMYSSLLRKSRLRTPSNLLLTIPDFGIRVCLNFRDSMLLLSCREAEVKESATLRIVIMNTIHLPHLPHIFCIGMSGKPNECKPPATSVHIDAEYEAEEEFTQLYCLNAVIWLDKKAFIRSEK